MAESSDTAGSPPDRRASVQCVVTPEESDEIGTSLRKAGFPNTSKGGRAVLLAFARHRDVRKAVMRHAPALLLTPESEDAA